MVDYLTMETDFRELFIMKTYPKVIIVCPWEKEAWEEGGGNWFADSNADELFPCSSFISSEISFNNASNYRAYSHEISFRQPQGWESMDLDPKSRKGEIDLLPSKL